MMSVPIAVAFDIASPIPNSLHAYSGAAVPPPPFAGTMEIPVPQYWPPGAAVMQNKLTRKTLARGQNIVQSGHDCGALINHLSIPPDNVLTLVHYPMSSRKTCFDASTVKYEGVASAAFPIPLMMICADPITLPGTTWSMTPQNVLVGMTIADIWRGALQIAVTILIDLLFLGLSSPKKIQPMGNAWANPQLLWDALFEKAVGVSRTGSEGFALSVAKIGVSAVTGFLVDASMQVDNPTLKVQAGHPLLGQEISVSRDGDGLSVDTAYGEAFAGGVDGAAERTFGPLQNLGAVL